MVKASCSASGYLVLCSLIIFDEFDRETFRQWIRPAEFQQRVSRQHQRSRTCVIKAFLTIAAIDIDKQTSSFFFDFFLA
jgi:hypothetical protein